MSSVRSSSSSALAFIVPALALVSGLSVPAQAQVVDLGATGAYGPLVVTTDTVLPIPESGVIHATTIQVAAGATLSFTPNAANTGVILTSVGDVVINGTITVDGQPSVLGAGGQGGPGGTRGGAPASHAHSAASHGAGGFDAFNCFGQAPEYCTPIAGGRGGTGSYWQTTTPASNCTMGNGGGGGGGHLYITSNSRISGTGIVSAQGGSGGMTKTNCGGNTTNATAPTSGDGGAVTLIAPRLSVAPMTVRLGTNGKLHLRTLDYEGNAPTLVGSNPQMNMSNTLVAWRPSPNVAVRITSINGVAVEPAETLTVTLTSDYTDVTAEATGCDRANLSLAVGYRQADNLYSSWGSPQRRSPSGGSASAIFENLFSPSPGQTFTVKAFASCHD